MKVPRLPPPKLSLLRAVALFMWWPCFQTLLGWCPRNRSSHRGGFCPAFEDKCHIAWGWSIFNPSKAGGQWKDYLAFTVELCFWKQVCTVGVWGHCLKMAGLVCRRCFVLKDEGWRDVWFPLQTKASLWEAKLEVHVCLSSRSQTTSVHFTFPSECQQKEHHQK